ncbi:MAG: hypothetical protein ACHQQS_03410 [Thermoanaerobaculales bacterium]
MTKRGVMICVVVVVSLGGVALAQNDPPLVNWAAPSYWTPPAATQPDRLGAHALGVPVGTMALTSLPVPFVAITPCRLVDTRHGPLDIPAASLRGIFTTGETRTYDFSQSSTCAGLPTSVAAWSLNFQYTTMRNGSPASFLTAWPAGIAMPSPDSTLLGYPDRWTASAAIIPGGTPDSSISVYAQNGGDVIIDVNGYYGQTGIATVPNPMQIAMLMWYHAANIPVHFNAGGDIKYPTGLAFDGAHIWVANFNGNSVTEINASDGSKVGTFNAGGDINGPEGLAFDGAHIWVANYNNNNVTKLNASDGTKVGTFIAGGDINAPRGLAFDGAHIWVANQGNNSVTELNASNGSEVGTFTAGGDINNPFGLAFDGAHVWVANYGSNSVTELNASNGSKVGTFNAGGDINGPWGLAFDGAHIWVANNSASSVTELNASDGSKVGTFNAGTDINHPLALAFDGAHIWVANFDGHFVTELNASDGSRVGIFNAGGDMNYPQALAFDGAHIWVANSVGNSLDKL